MSVLPLLPIFTAAAGAVASQAADRLLDGLAFFDHLVGSEADEAAIQGSQATASEASPNLAGDALSALKSQLDGVLGLLKQGIDAALAAGGMAAEGALQLRLDGDQWRVAGHPQGEAIAAALSREPQWRDLFHQARQLALQVRQEEIGRQFAEKSPWESGEAARWQSFDGDRAASADFALLVEGGRVRPVFQAR